MGALFSFTRSTKQTKTQEVVDLKDVDGPEMVEVAEAEPDEDHQVEQEGEGQHHPVDWELDNI